MGNSIELNCIKKYGECTYWSAIHGGNYKEERYKLCGHCTRRTVVDYRDFLEKRGKDKV